MKNKLEDSGVKPGAPWKTIGRFSTYEQASQKSHEIKGSDTYKDHQIKIRRMNDPESFVIKVRSTSVAEDKPKKKRGKGKNSTKKG